MDKFKNTYRTTSHRKPNWDYSNDAIYYLTIVRQHRTCDLGEIVDGKMNLSDFGEIVHHQWIKSFEMRHELFLDKYVIMPNHIHAIVVLKNDNINGECTVGGHTVGGRTVGGRTAVETHGRASLPSQQQQQQQQQQPHKQKLVRQPKSISSFMAGFKSAVNSKIDDFIDDNNLNIPKYNRNNHFFQPNYHDHIIRNTGEYHRIVKYINDNPKNWDNDNFK
ncbi:transposase [Saccharicrinis fermentans]|uniref:Transposase n=1 Tax=Saccharicrinis fermentans DSM 9555 = JCM 21142 TaxID=869213 RepID=W7YME6_9BACT|nr:transposase [Saccharicrinis fermentans]GAF05841.1 transposase [Saccharicrinis fermentans DSM 9555 = JCM 21142]